MSNSVLKRKPSLWGWITHPYIQMDRMKDTPVIWQPLFISLAIYLACEQLAHTVIEEQIYPETKTLYHVFDLHLLLLSLWLSLFTIALTALIFYLITRIFRKNVHFVPLLTLSIHLFFISSLAMVIQAIARFTPLSNEWASLSITAWMDTDFQSITLFAIWAFLLTAIGLTRVGQLSKPVAWITTCCFYTLFGFIL